MTKEEEDRAELDAWTNECEFVNVATDARTHDELVLRPRVSLAERTEDECEIGRRRMVLSHTRPSRERFDNEDQRKLIVDREEENADITV